jgi:hypothetical protein
MIEYSNPVPQKQSCNVMGTSFRMFVIDDDDSLSRIPVARYQRSRTQEPDGDFPQYAGRRVRCAMVVLQVAGRIPLSIERIDYSMLLFDSKGYIDTAEQEKKARLAVEVLPPFENEERPAQVINARNRFAKRRYENEFKWKPTPAMQAAIVAAILGKEPA